MQPRNGQIDGGWSAEQTPGPPATARPSCMLIKDAGLTSSLTCAPLSSSPPHRKQVTTSTPGLQGGLLEAGCLLGDIIVIIIILAWPFMGS